MRSFGGTASGPNLAAIARAFLGELPYARAAPVRSLEHSLIERPLPPDWCDRLLAPDVDGFGVEWEGRQVMKRKEGSVVVNLPDDLCTPKPVLDFLAQLPLELFVLAFVEDYWPENGYHPPAIGADHALLGWGMVFKGAGHDHSIVSRRWLEHGPFRTLHGANDTTMVQFHDLTADGSTSLAQAKPGHEWIVTGFLRPKHRYRNDIGGIYTEADRLLRIVVNGRTVSPAEMLDACAARRDCRNDPDKPIENIAYMFVDEAEARAHLEALWLRGLECRVFDGKGERRLDTDYKPTIAKPGWV